MKNRYREFCFIAKLQHQIAFSYVAFDSDSENDHENNYQNKQNNNINKQGAKNKNDDELNNSKAQYSSNNSKLLHQVIKNKKQEFHIDNFEIDFEDDLQDEIQDQKQKGNQNNPRKQDNSKNQINHNDEEDEEEMEINLDELTPEQFQELLKNPKLAALFANMQNGDGILEGSKQTLFNHSQYMQPTQEKAI